MRLYYAANPTETKRMRLAIGLPKSILCGVAFWRALVFTGEDLVLSACLQCLGVK